MKARARQLVAAAAAAFGVALCMPSAAQPPVQLAWRSGDEMVAVQRAAAHEGAVAVTPSTAARTPLGSVWKLFVYAYLTGSAADETPYRCEAAAPATDEEYCCDPGESVGRDEALARSCGPYFEPKRLGSALAGWQRYWQGRNAPAWLARIAALRPETEVPVADLLDALASVPGESRVAARSALLPVSVRSEGVLAALGSGPRFKTWSWRVGGERAGGAAGWLADGTPFWLQGPGTSKSVLRSQASWAALQLQRAGLSAVPADAAVRAADPCIDVDFFNRYPIETVRRGDGTAAAAGALSGRHRISFRNGTQLAIEAEPVLRLAFAEGVPVIAARLPLEDYVARVVDREGRAGETEAARALAVAARSYALQNAAAGEGCRRIADDSRTQRVSPNAPSPAARAAAAFTEGLVLTGVEVRYHSNRAAPNVMAWEAAAAAGRGGAGFESILRTSYPGAGFGGVQGGSECEALPEAEHWLRLREAKWRPLLRAEAGFEPPGAPLRVCQLAMGTPHSDQRRGLIHVREWQSREGRVTLIHEYLHLAFRGHPRGRDEAFVERTAQRLADL